MLFLEVQGYELAIDIRNEDEGGAGQTTQTKADDIVTMREQREAHRTKSKVNSNIFTLCFK